METDDKGPDPTTVEEEADWRRRVSELVWLPSYAGVAYIAIGASGTTGLVVFLSLLLCRVFLEVLYRIVFGKQRHDLAIGVTAFAAQCVVWGAVWYWYVARNLG
jgi:hypothetical protein